MKKYSNYEFLNIVSPILENIEFERLKNVDHHGITRYEHCLRVSYYTYIITKYLGFNYEEATIAALLHDFFTDEVCEDNGIQRLRKHPTYAVENAKKYFSLTLLQEDIIKTHMFPVTFLPPKYLESWIVDIVDDIAAIYERIFSIQKEIKAALIFLFVLLFY